jgi:predicted MFS family arabinose efflux permease
MTAILELGAMFGALLSGYLADRSSRKRAIMFGLVFFLLGAVLQSVSQNYATLVVGSIS